MKENKITELDMRKCQICHKEKNWKKFDDLLCHVGVSHKYLQRCMNTLPNGDTTNAFLEPDLAKGQSQQFIDLTSSPSRSIPSSDEDCLNRHKYVYKCQEAKCRNRLYRSRAHAIKHASLKHCSSTLLRGYDSNSRFSSKKLLATKSCEICGKTLASKHHLLMHLHVVHKFWRQEEMDEKICKVASDKCNWL